MRAAAQWLFVFATVGALLYGCHRYDEASYQRYLLDNAACNNHNCTAW